MPQRLTTFSLEPLEYSSMLPPPPLATLVTSMSERLFLPSLKAFWATVRDYAAKNQELKGYPPYANEGFSVNGEFYRVEGAPITKGAKLPALHESLHDKFQAIMQAEIKIEDDKGRIRMFLTNLLRPCETWLDVCDALPDCAHDLIDGAEKHTRKREAGYTMMDTPMYKRSYENNVELLEYYSVARLLD